MVMPFKPGESITGEVGKLLDQFGHVNAEIRAGCPLLAITSVYYSCANHAIVLVAVTIVSSAIKGNTPDQLYDDFYEIVKSVVGTIKKATGWTISFSSWRLEPGPQPCQRYDNRPGHEVCVLQKCIERVVEAANKSDSVFSPIQLVNLATCSSDMDSIWNEYQRPYAAPCHPPQLTPGPSQV